MGGVAVNTRSYRGTINYAVVPIVFNEKLLNIKATIVSCLWIVSIVVYKNKWFFKLFYLIIIRKTVIIMLNKSPLSIIINQLFLVALHL